MKRSAHLLLLALLFTGLAACGGASDTDSADASEPEATSAMDGMPIQNVDLGPIDAALASEGQQIYETRCTTCHKMDARYVGPPLADVMDQRDPVYVMNMILAPEKMIQQHPEAKELFAEYGTIMTNQNLTEEQARAILEYLRQVSEDAAN